MKKILKVLGITVIVFIVCVAVTFAGWYIGNLLPTWAAITLCVVTMGGSIFYAVYKLVK